MVPPLLGVTPIFAVSFWVSYLNLLHKLWRNTNSKSLPLKSLPSYLAILQQGYDLGQKIVRAATPSRTSPQFTTAEYATAGFISAIPQTFIAAPIERAKVLLQIQGQGGSAEKAKYNGVLDVVRGLYREGGIRSIFRGTGATLARDGPGSAACVFFFLPQL